MVKIHNILFSSFARTGLRSCETLLIMYLFKVRLHLTGKFHIVKAVQQSNQICKYVLLSVLFVMFLQALEKGTLGDPQLLIIRDEFPVQSKLYLFGHSSQQQTFSPFGRSRTVSPTTISVVKVDKEATDVSTRHVLSNQ